MCTDWPSNEKEEYTQPSPILCSLLHWWFTHRSSSFAVAKWPHHLAVFFLSVSDWLWAGWPLAHATTTHTRTEEGVPRVKSRPRGSGSEMWLIASLLHLLSPPPPSSSFLRSLTSCLPSSFPIHSSCSSPSIRDIFIHKVEGGGTAGCHQMWLVGPVAGYQPMVHAVYDITSHEARSAVSMLSEME